MVPVVLIVICRSKRAAISLCPIHCTVSCVEPSRVRPIVPCLCGRSRFADAAVHCILHCILFLTGSVCLSLSSLFFLTGCCPSAERQVESATTFGSAAKWSEPRRTGKEQRGSGAGMHRRTQIKLHCLALRPSCLASHRIHSRLSVPARLKTFLSKIIKSFETFRPCSRATFFLSQKQSASHPDEVVYPSPPLA